MEKTTKSINFEIKDINDEERSFLAVASTEDIDRDGDRIMAAGWDLQNFLKNPVIPWAHNYGDPPVAKAVSVSVEDSKLMFRPKFPDPGTFPFADTIWKLYKGGFLNAFSVGFMPRRWENVEREKGIRGRDYQEQELWEILACTVPSNPNALIAAKSAGVITEEEESQISNLKFQIQDPPAREELTLQCLYNIEKTLGLIRSEIEALKPQPEPAPAMAEEFEISNLKSQTPSPEAIEDAVKSALSVIEERIAAIVETRLNYHLGKV